MLAIYENYDYRENEDWITLDDLNKLLIEINSFKFLKLN